MTGAPKLRAMRAISELEPSARGVYTGAIGYSTPDAAVFNVAIRTFEISRGRIELGVGGGVTVDSVPMLEWHETRHKAAPLITAIGGSLAASTEVRPTDDQLAGGLLETMLSVDGELRRSADHLARIDLSCRELYGVPAAGRRRRTGAEGGRRRARTHDRAPHRDAERGRLGDGVTRLAAPAGVGADDVGPGGRLLAPQVGRPILGH